MFFGRKKTPVTFNQLDEGVPTTTHAEGSSCLQEDGKHRRLVRGIYVLPNPINQDEFFQPWILQGNSLHPTAPEVAPPPVAAGYKKRLGKCHIG